MVPLLALAPLTIAATEKKIWEATADEKLSIPLTHTRRSEFSGSILQLKTSGEGFEQVPRFDVPLGADTSEAVLDLKTLKTLPGDYLIAFYGSAVAKYKSDPAAAPKDTVEIVISEPIAIRVKPAEAK